MSASVAACDNESNTVIDNSSNSSTTKIVSNDYVSKVNYEAEHPYVEYKGKPYLMLAVQMRLDWIYEDQSRDIAFIQENFAKAKEDGFDSVIIPISWNQIEPEKGVFNFDRLELYYKYLDEYDLSVQWIWGGTNSCGSGAAVPEDIRKDPETYKRMLTGKPEIDDMIGKDGAGVVWIDFSCKATMEREQTALAAMMEWIAENDKNKRCVMIQVDNEVDQGAGNFQPDQTDATQNLVGQWWQTKEGHDKYCWVGGQRDAVFAQLSALGDVIHKSSYNCVTRVNLSGAGRDTIPDLKLDYMDLLDTTGIDIVGVDCYATTWDALANYITESGDNVTHIAEASCTYEFGYSVAKMFERGEGILLYCHRDDRADFGMYERTTRQNQQWVEKPTTAESRQFLQMLRKVGDKLAFAVPNGEVLEFNGEHTKGGVDVTSTLNKLSIRFTNNNDALGMAFPVSDKEWILMANRDNCQFEFDDSVTVSAATFGKYDGDNWKVQNTSAVQGNKVTVNAYQVVKVDLK